MLYTHSTILALATILPAVLGHYNFEALIVNGNVTKPYEYVRQTTNSNSPITDVTSADMICNQGGLDADIMSRTSTYTVSPGDIVGFTVNVQISHPGPLAVYMSKAPDSTAAKAYKGGGDWFKVYELTTSAINAEGLQWATYIDNVGVKNFTFTLPSDLAAGDYLMRAESIALHSAESFGGAQFYIGCAQLTVTGDKTGTPSPTVKFPGAYTGREPGIMINIYYPVPTTYTAPGPATWPRACIDHSVNILGKAYDGDCTGSGNSTAPASPSTVASILPTASVSTAPTANSTTPWVVSSSIASTAMPTSLPAEASTGSAATVATSLATAPSPSTVGTAAPSSPTGHGSGCKRRRSARWLASKDVRMGRDVRYMRT